MSIKDLKQLLKEIDVNIKECEKFEKMAAKRGEYTDAIKLIGMEDAYKKVRWNLSKIINTSGE
jgi:hypothetical protein